MEDNIQTIIVVIISAFLLFIFPVYMAYEKKDDISYALAMRYTQDLVDEVRSKGYITKNMYEDYRARLKLTGNSYDIKLTHEYNRYDPITNYYTTEDGKYVLVKTTTQQTREDFEEIEIEHAINVGKLSSNPTTEEKEKHLQGVYEAQGINKVEDTYQVSKQVYTTDHIVSVLNSERKLQLNSNTETVRCSDSEEADDGCQHAYTMNVDDNFNITIKNTNVTLATVIYNMVTANTLDDNTRIYVNYGGLILSSKWYGDIDYAKMDHDNISLNKFEELVIFEEQREFKAKPEDPVATIIKTYENEYVLEFDVKPNNVTELREKGQVRVADYTGYNFAIGNSQRYNKNNMLSVSVGINGISLIANTTQNFTANTIESLILPTYQKPVERTRTVQETYTYIDDETGEEKTGVRDKLETYIEYITEQRKITDYSSLTLNYVSKGVVNISLVGKSGVPNINQNVSVTDNEDLLKGLTSFITNPESGVKEGTIGSATNLRGTNVSYSIIITETTIKISASKYVSEELTILSYPVTIDEYVNVRIEMEQKDNSNYVANLYIDDEKADESIEMAIVPKVNIVGKTIIGNEERLFNGYIKNVRIYSKISE